MRGFSIHPAAGEYLGNFQARIHRAGARLDGVASSDTARLKLARRSTPKIFSASSSSSSSFAAERVSSAQLFRLGAYTHSPCGSRTQETRTRLIRYIFFVRAYQIRFRRGEADGIGRVGRGALKRHLTPDRYQLASVLRHVENIDSRTVDFVQHLQP